MLEATKISDKDLKLVTAFADAGYHPAHLHYQGAGNTARALEPIMDALALPRAAWGKGIWSGHIVVPASYAKRRADLAKAEAAGRDAFEGISGKISDGKFWTHPRCPYRDPGKARFWRLGYEAAFDAFNAVYED